MPWMICLRYSTFLLCSASIFYIYFYSFIFYKFSFFYYFIANLCSSRFRRFRSRLISFCSACCSSAIIFYISLAIFIWCFASFLAMALARPFKLIFARSSLFRFDRIKNTGLARGSLGLRRLRYGKFSIVSNSIVLARPWVDCGLTYFFLLLCKGNWWKMG